MIQIKDIPDYSIILADSYLHHEIRKELCKDKKGRIISVLSFSNYIKTTQNIEQDQVLFSYYKILKPIENSFPVLKSILSTKQFLNEIFSFHTKRVKYKIDLNSLPVNSLAEKELAHIINITKDIQLPIDEEQESFSHILQKDLSNIYILESFMDKYEENCIQQLYKKGAHKINFKEVSPVTSFYYAKNIRQEVESVAQYIIEKDLDVNDIKISISQDSYQPFIKQIFERYQIPYRFIRQTKTSNTVNRFLSVLNYAEKKDLTSFLEMLDYNIFRCKHLASLDNYLRLFKKDIHDDFQHIRNLNISYDVVSETDIQRLKKMEEEANLSRNEIIDETDKLLNYHNYRELFLNAYKLTENSLINKNEETENLIMIQNMILKHADHIHNSDDLHFFMELCKDLTTSVKDENMNSLPVLSITQPYFFKKYHFVLGCLESCYPAFPVENGIFDEDYMQKLAYPTMQERFEFHKLQCLNALKTNENIIFSYPAGNFDGKSNESSLMIETFANKKPILFPLKEHTFRYQINRFKKIENAKDLYVKENKIHGSVSSIEMYVKCPYAYFLKYGLKIKEPIENKLSDHTVGTFMHYILETLVNTYKKEYVNVEENELKDIIHKKILELTEVYPQKKDEFICLETRLLKTMLNTIENLKSHEAASKLTPEKCEETFEYDIPITKDVKWSLKGIVDRIDMDRDFFRIVDYKSSMKDLSEEKVFEALQLQLLTYLMVMKHKLNRKPIGAYYYSFKNENISLNAFNIGRKSTKAYTVEENSSEEYKSKHKMVHRMNGWSTAFDLDIIDEDATHIKGLKISNDEVTASKIYNPDVLEEYFMEMYRFIGEQLLSGDISCIPEESACLFCPYTSICKGSNATFKRDALIELKSDLYLKGVKQMIKWNEEQLKAIHTKNKNVLVSASAGAGKTTVLIARLERILMEDRIGIDHILAMTFTEAAASEMKKRLSASLNKSIDETNDENDKQYLKEQVSKLQNANISTIHSFCLSILKKYAYVIHVKPSRIENIMNEADCALFKKEALNLVFEEAYKENNPSFTDLCMMFSARCENDEALFSAIRQCASLASSRIDPISWLNNIKNTYQDFKSINELPNEILNFFYEYYEMLFTGYKQILDELKKHFDMFYPTHKNYPQIVLKQVNIEEIENTLKLRDYETFRQLILLNCKVALPRNPDSTDKKYPELKKQVQNYEDTLVSDLYSEIRLLKDLKDASPTLNCFIDLTVHFLKTYQRLKEERDMIDFDDMEHMSIEILKKNNCEIANKYKDNFYEIMVDEFQDNNDVQDELVKMISKGNNVFRVGDIKQSIYGFRHAKPSIMQSLIENKTENDEVIYLNNNFRSKESIVKFNNELFTKLMNLPIFSGKYTEQDCVSIGTDLQKINNSPVYLHQLGYKEIDPDKQFTRDELRAHYIANQILKIKEKGPITNENTKEFYDSPTYMWKDFVILTRSNANKDVLRKVFEELNIPCFIDTKSGFYQSNSVQLVLSLLKTMVHPHDDLSFISVCTSPLFNISEELMIDAKLHKDKDSYYSYFTNKYPVLFDEFIEIKNHIYELSISECIRRIYNFKNFYMDYTDIQDKTNLDLLYEKAVAYEQNDSKNILGFLSMIESIEDEETAEAIPIGVDDDVVRVMTIHQSKGLQFPVVFLWSKSELGLVELKDNYIFDDVCGIGLKYIELPYRYVRKTLPRIALEHKKRKEFIEEEMRVLYVATTRAQKEMHVVDVISTLEKMAEPKELTASSIYQKCGYTSWMKDSFIDESLFQKIIADEMWPINKVISDTQKNDFVMKTYSKQNKEEINLSPTSQFTYLPEFSFHKSNADVTGTALHKIIELSDTTIWTKQSILHLAQKINYDINEDEISSLITLYHNPLFQKTLTYPHVFHELPFMAEVEQQMYHGFIDYLAVNDKEVIIIDFKSNKRTTEDKLKEMYEHQIYIYMKAIKVIYPDHLIKGYLYSLSLHKEIEIL